MDTVKIQQYFNPSIMPKKDAIKYGTILICMGGIMSTSDKFPAIGIFMIIAGASLLIVTLKKPSISDAEYDNYVSAFVNISHVKELALDKLGLDESEVTEIEPIILSGYVYQGADLLKQGTDGQWRSNKYEIFALFFTVNELHCYTKRVSTTGGRALESTDVYFYKDIVSASTTYETFTRPQQGAIPAVNVDYECFKLTTSAGTSITVSLRDVDGIQKSINAMRALLKEKKSQ
ncbi:hypothetical protein RFF05_03740 [Bengtsoniella intestinalis]|uniref:hypothetical protein n=1 Tax=Bengtsoniella intestinalis TaxID=3073143 RepID=UPI00391F9450